MPHFPAYLLDCGLVRQFRPGRDRSGQRFVSPASKAIAEGMRAAETFSGGTPCHPDGFGIGAHGHLQYVNDNKLLFQLGIQADAHLDSARLASFRVSTSLSKSFTCFFCGFAFFTAVSVRGMGVTPPALG